MNHPSGQRPPSVPANDRSKADYVLAAQTGDPTGWTIRLPSAS